ncbi:MerR family transcriptional regulator [Atopomonas sediminilitoris]|uniref:MerR family transcriptional regulator n=1 Tax=Atopomonas sediminilitoris TaxID=2919919 RepID=UPI001F4E8DC4|nr:MerR family transcriptional regulator [Atopomonas sediminilitoris]MCJ8168089.1 MerR family transcriptional regulator [Atopomonas sediminilitoris]
MPISTLARQCGIAPATLRAWERRYGLIKPERSSKGHRLYPREQIERVHNIMAWINRGVPVGQVGELLDHDTPSLSDDSPWQTQRSQWLQWCKTQNTRRLEDAFNQALSLYPAPLICRELLLPLLEDVQPERHGLHVTQVFLHTWLRSKISQRISHNSAEKRADPVLLINAGSQALEPEMWLLAWLLSSQGTRVELLDWPLQLPELILWQEQRSASAVVLYASSRLQAPLSIEQLRELQQRTQATLLLAGHCVSIHADSLASEPNLLSARDPFAALEALSQLGISAQYLPLGTEANR